MERQSRKLLSQLEVNPRENVSAITLRSGKGLPPIEAPPVEDVTPAPIDPICVKEGSTPKIRKGVHFDPPLSVHYGIPKAPFPSRLARPRK